MGNRPESIAQRKLNSAVRKNSAKDDVIQCAGSDLEKNGYTTHNDPGFGLPKIYYRQIGTEHRYVALRSTFYNTAGTSAGATFGHAHAGAPYSNEYGFANDINGTTIGAGTAGVTMPNTTVVHVVGHMLPSQYGGRGIAANTFEQNYGENGTNPWRASEDNARNVWDTSPGNPWCYYSLHL